MEIILLLTWPKDGEVMKNKLALYTFLQDKKVFGNFSMFIEKQIIQRKAPLCNINYCCKFLPILYTTKKRNMSKFKFPTKQS